MNPYCQYCNDHPEDIFNCDYHENLYGYPVSTDNALFERLMLEINQAGLSWITILKKADAFHQAFNGFDIDVVAGYKEDDIERLMGNAGIIRNRRKIEAAIFNANVILSLRAEHGSFKDWLDQRVGFELAEWVKEFRSIFKFTGPEIVKEFLWSTGYMAGAHSIDCPVYERILAVAPPWMK